MSELLKDPAFWTAVALVIFVAGLLLANVHGALIKSLDARAVTIKGELDEARRLREEASALFALHQRKQREAQKETEEILALAREEARIAAEEAREALAALIDRRRQQAEDKIARAEEQAVKDIRAYAASISIGAARRFIRSRIDERRSTALIDGAIAALPEKLRGR